ncbi:hypothetical protein [Mycoplasma crocodyli]|uniref:Transmembrane protein n=1 Tax=Mycoplasma crocodyli (strain ATCC 51981 / MP145) TaxID=512564 RepID=D5E515_MYCCM|nr:hypothetical protein [Mycoplasma crocodyli]ADE19792.1 hypothetical protein MCRO_0204 [Mycoplasma crocodyli MP145]
MELFKIEFNFYGLAGMFLIVLSSILYTYLIKVIYVSKFSKKLKMNENSIHFSKSILEKSNIKAQYKFKSNFYVLDVDKIKNRLNVDDKLSSSYSIYSFVHLTFLTFLYTKTKKLNNYLVIIVSYLNIITYMNILWMLPFNLWFIALIMFVVSLIFNLTIIILEQKINRYSIDSTFELLKYKLDEKDFYEAVGLLKNYKFYSLDRYLESGLKFFVEFVKAFNKWGKND